MKKIQLLAINIRNGISIELNSIEFQWKFNKNIEKF